MEFSEYFPIFSKLTAQEQKEISEAVTFCRIPKGNVIYRSSDDCLGLLLICSGQLRAYILSDEGQEITVYRLFQNDACLLTASCAMQSINFNITISAEKDTEAWLIPAAIYKTLMNKSAVIANYTNKIMGERFSGVMWLIEQIMWKSFDKRLAEFLSDEYEIENSHLLKLTHEKIASHLGTAREVVTRMLKYFQEEGLVRLSRGSVEILNIEKLKKMCE